MSLSRAATASAGLIVLLAVAGCSRDRTRSAMPGRPVALLGQTCDRCGMPVDDARFAAERAIAGEWRIYDSIECLIDDAGAGAPFGSWLADHDRGTLHRSDSMWVVHGSFPSPMGRGLAAFLSRPSADSLARASGGEVGPLTRWAAPDSG